MLERKFSELGTDKQDMLQSHNHGLHNLCVIFAYKLNVQKGAVKIDAAIGVSAHDIEQRNTRIISRLCVVNVREKSEKRREKNDNF